MASAPVPKAFEGFTRLSPNSYIYETQASGNTSIDLPSPSHPDLILFMAWLDSQPKHVAKYINYYKTYYPNTRIILVTAETKDMILRTKAGTSKCFNPVAAALHALPPSAKVLLHSCSNGGLASAAQVAKEFHQRTGAPLPIQALVIDSAPGYPRFWADIRALSAGLPKNLFAQAIGKATLIVLYVLFGTGWWVTGAGNPIKTNRALANNEEYFQKSTPRAYIYSRKDAMVEWRDVENHIADAKELGYKVHGELFEESQHVNHMPTDSKRYWGVVHSLWKSSFEVKP